MNDEQLLRYSRQIMLPQLDYAGQLKLTQSTALIIGVGGLGSPAATYLTTAGVGHLILVDFDTVELSNLQRQPLHGDADIGKTKVTSAAESLRRLNPDTRITPVHKKLEQDELEALVAQADIVLDCSDNFATRYAVNRACQKMQTPLVFAAAIRLEGQATTFLPGADNPCYQCLYKNAQGGDETCSQNGVLAPLVGILGCIQATEAIKVLSGLGKPLVGRLLLVDVYSMDFRLMKYGKDHHCESCQ